MRRTDRTYFLITGLFNFSWAFIAPTYVLFLLDRGLDLFQASVVPAVFFIVSVVFEVPTGAFADVVGRKPSFLLSCFVRMIAFGMYAFAHTFPAFIVAEFVDALGATLANGALDAWGVDARMQERDGEPHDRFFARAVMVARAAITVSGLAGGYLAERDPALPWFCAAASFALTGAIAAWTMRETPRRAPAHAVSRPSLRATASAGLVAVRDVPMLRLLCLVTLAIAFATMPALHVSWPWFRSLSGARTGILGWIWVLVNVAMLTGSVLLTRLFGARRRALVLSVVTAWRGVMLALGASAATFAPAVAGLLLMEAGYGLSEPLLLAWLNEHVATEQRATVLSVRSMCLTFGQGTGLLCLGRVARDWSIPGAWLASALVLVIIAPVFLLLARRAEAAATPRDDGRVAQLSRSA